MIEHVGPFRIERTIGRGGMGVVYLARDTKLDRDVAVKALPQELAEDADRLARFEREAKTLAPLRCVPRGMKGVGSGNGVLQRPQPPSGVMAVSGRAVEPRAGARRETSSDAFGACPAARLAFLRSHR